jgi:uncharacterized protein (DUF2062 family)
MSSRIGRAAQMLLRIDEPPHRTALAFAIGVLIAFSPILGLHTVLALAIAFLFRLNRVAILLGAYINNPWTMGPIYLAGTAVGCALLGVSAHDLGMIDWSLAGLMPYLWPFVIGNMVLGVVAGSVSYVLARRFLSSPHAPTAPQPGADGQTGST